MGLGAGVRVDMVLQRSQRLEAALAHRTLVRPLLRVGLHVPGQQVTARGDNAGEEGPNGTTAAQNSTDAGKQTYENRNIQALPPEL